MPEKVEVPLGTDRLRPLPRAVAASTLIIAAYAAPSSVASVPIRVSSVQATQPTGGISISRPSTLRIAAFVDMEPITAELTQADLDLLTRAARSGVQYLDLDDDVVYDDD